MIIVGKPLIMVSSVTYALKGKEILNRKGFTADLVRTPKHKNIGGCGYSIYVPKNTDKAEEILKESGIKVIGRTDKEGTL